MKDDMKRNTCFESVFLVRRKQFKPSKVYKVYKLIFFFLSLQT